MQLTGQRRPRFSSESEQRTNLYALELNDIWRPNIFNVCLPSASQNISCSPVFSWHYPLITLRPRGLCISFAILATLKILIDIDIIALKNNHAFLDDCGRKQQKHWFAYNSSRNAVIRSILSRWVKLKLGSKGVILEVIAGWGNTLGLSTVRWNAQICCRHKGQSWSARTGSVPKKLKMRLGGKWPLIGKISQFCS